MTYFLPFLMFSLCSRNKSHLSKHFIISRAPTHLCLEDGSQFPRAGVFKPSFNYSNSLTRLGTRRKQGEVRLNIQNGAILVNIQMQRNGEGGVLEPFLLRSTLAAENQAAEAMLRSEQLQEALRSV